MKNSEKLSLFKNGTSASRGVSDVILKDGILDSITIGRRRPPDLYHTRKKYYSSHTYSVIDSDTQCTCSAYCTAEAECGGDVDGVNNAAAGAASNGFTDANNTHKGNCG